MDPVEEEIYLLESFPSRNDEHFKMTVQVVFVRIKFFCNLFTNFS